MNALDNFKIRQGDWTVIQSSICSAAYSLSSVDEYAFLKSRVTELSESYFNQWRFVIEAYEKLYELFFLLNNAEDKIEAGKIITEFDMRSLKIEIEFKNYAYLFVVSLKTLLDLFTCLVDVTQNHIVRNEDRMPDFFQYGKRPNNENPIPEIISAYDEQRLLSSEHNWIKKIKLVRDRVIHRGYLLKPIIGFSKIENLLMHVYNGAQSHKNLLTIDIGLIFEQFLNEMPILETKISNILFEKISCLNSAQSFNATFRYTELINQYEFKEINIPKIL